MRSLSVIVTDNTGITRILIRGIYEFLARLKIPMTTIEKYLIINLAI